MGRGRLPVLVRMRIRFMVTTSLDARLAPSVKPGPHRLEGKQNDAETFIGSRWTTQAFTHIGTPLEPPYDSTRYNQDYPLNVSFNYCRKDNQKLGLFFYHFGGHYL